MSQSVDIKSLYQRFLALCEAYNENQDMLTALTLDEVAGQLKQESVSQLGAGALHDLLHQLLRIIQRGDMAEFHRVLDAIRSAAEEYDLA